jgi:hypothetical protein
MTKNIPNGDGIDQMAIKIYQLFPIQDPPKFTQIGNFGMKIYHLATLRETQLIRNEDKKRPDQKKKETRVRRNGNIGQEDNSLMSSTQQSQVQNPPPRGQEKCFSSL